MATNDDPLVAQRATMDGEHRVQAGLIEALCVAVEIGDSDDDIDRILEQLIDYSEAHFMSEELLMRLDSYDHFAAHVEQHATMMEALRELLAERRAGRSTLIPGKARAALAFLRAHIDNQDRRYSDWKREPAA